MNGITGLTRDAAQREHARVMSAHIQPRSQRATGILRGLDMLLIPPMLDSQVGRDEVMRLAVEASALLRTRWCHSCGEWPQEAGDDRRLCSACRDDYEAHTDADTAERLVVDGWR